MFLVPWKKKFQSNDTSRMAWRNLQPKNGYRTLDGISLQEGIEKFVPLLAKCLNNKGKVHFDIEKYATNLLTDPRN